MAPLNITTYRHDYADPKELAFGMAASRNVANNATINEPVRTECICDSNALAQPSSNATNDAAGATEWTGIAPMGILLQPRVIHANGGMSSADMEDDNRACSSMDTQFLDNLHNASPTLYDDLRRMNADDLQTVINVDRLLSTYQNDYCRNAWSEPTNGNVNNDDHMIQTFRAEQQQQHRQCAGSEHQILGDNQQSVRIWPPRRPAVCCRHCFNKLAKQEIPPLNSRRIAIPSTEYRSTYSKLGDIIQTHNLNDHRKCKAKCEHAINLNLLPCRNY